MTDSKYFPEHPFRDAAWPRAEPVCPVNHPPHYVAHPSGIECIQITEHMGFCLGSAVEYIWRADLKGDAIQDLEKARWYIDREISLRKRPGPDGATITVDDV